MTLTEFLLARIAEDEQAAHFEEYGMPIPGNSWGPERVLAECEARRRIVAHHGLTHVCLDPDSRGFGGEDLYDEDFTPCEVVRLLALPYADHPGFDPAWRIS